MGGVAVVISSFTNDFRLRTATAETHRRAVTARMPLASLTGYSTALRSLSQGDGTFTMAFEAYQGLPQDREARLLSDLRGY